MVVDISSNKSTQTNYYYVYVAEAENHDFKYNCKASTSFQNHCETICYYYIENMTNILKITVKDKDKQLQIKSADFYHHPTNHNENQNPPNKRSLLSKY